MGRKNQARERQASPIILLAFLGAAVILLGAGVYLIAGRPGGNGAGPRLALDQEQIDFGRVPLNKPVRAVFKVTNTGDRTLTLDASAPVKVLKGC